MQPTLDQFFGWPSQSSSSSSSNGRDKGNGNGKKRNSNPMQEEDNVSLIRTHYKYLTLPHYSKSKMASWDKEIVPTLNNVHIDTVDQLIAILSNWGQYTLKPEYCEPEKGFGNLKEYLADLDRDKDDESKKQLHAVESQNEFFHDLLPFIKSLVLRLPVLFPENERFTSLPLSHAGENKRIELSKIQIACLLACKL
jgi:hypothetical protein